MCCIAFILVEITPCQLSYTFSNSAPAWGGEPLTSLLTCIVLSNGVTVLDKLNDDAVVYHRLALVPCGQHQPRSLYHTQSPHSNDELRAECKIL